MRSGGGASMDAPKIRIKADLNTTRVSARLNLIFTTLRMHKVVKIYSALYPGSRVRAAICSRSHNNASFMGEGRRDGDPWEDGVS